MVELKNPAVKAYVNLNTGGQAGRAYELPKRLTSEDIERNRSPKTAAAPSENLAASPGKGTIEDAMEAARQLAAYSRHSLKFEYQKEADIFQVSVIAGDSEIIRKIPPDSVLHMIENLKKYMGSTIDTRA
ncbi:MAG: flagellar protein FlaG [Synergistaceae bacterium]|jgi:uncharacterized FlaG/YvyC family protein|nr:flagellar protein FlaG [Synergistaceae bacterium]